MAWTFMEAEVAMIKIDFSSRRAGCAETICLGLSLHTADADKQSSVSLTRKNKNHPAFRENFLAQAKTFQQLPE